MAVRERKLNPVKMRVFHMPLETIPEQHTVDEEYIEEGFRDEEFQNKWRRRIIFIKCCSMSQNICRFQIKMKNSFFPFFWIFGVEVCKAFGKLEGTLIQSSSRTGPSAL